MLLNCLPAVSGGGIAYIQHIVPRLDALFATSTDNVLIVLAHESQRGLFRDVADDRFVLTRGRRPTGLRRVLWERRMLPDMAKSLSADVLFTPYQIAPRVSNMRSVVVFSNMEPFRASSYRYTLRSRLRNSVLARLTASSVRSADRVIAVSELTREVLTRELGVSDAQIRVAPLGRDAAFHPSGDVAQDDAVLASIGVRRPYVFTCGSVLPYRRIEDVIAAFEALPSDRAGEQLVIAGSGSDTRYATEIERATAGSTRASDIKRAGHVSREAMYVLYRRASVVVFATEVEACPNIAIEAMASGSLVLSTDRRPMTDMFGNACVYYPGRDVRALSSTLARMLADPTTFTQYRRKAFERSHAFSWDACAQQIYETLVTW